MNEKIQEVISLYDGIKTSADIASIVGLSPRYVRRIATKYDLKRLHCGAQKGKNNHQFVSGRRIDLDGYVVITAPDNHPYARKRANRKGKLIFEHRLVMENKIGRYLLDTEVVDHIDGLTLNNNPDNLRLFYNNGDHLHTTILSLPKQISISGRVNLKIKHRQPEDFLPVDTYGRRRKRGDIRLRQTLLAWLKLDKDSPFLSGTEYWLRKAHISDTSRPSLKRALDALYQRYAEDLAQ